jgi:hypothetical protein
VAFFITVGASIYIATSSEISASTDSSGKVTHGSVAINNYLDTTMPVRMWRCIEFQIKYIAPTTAAGPSGQLSENSVITTFRNDIYNAFKSANSGLVFYETQADIKADIDKCAGGDEEACSRAKKGVLKSALKPHCDSPKAYDVKPIINPDVIYGAAAAPASATNSSSNETKNFNILVTDKNKNVVSDAEVSIDIPNMKGGTEFTSCTPANGKCEVVIKEANIDKTKKLFFHASLADGFTTPFVEKLWQDIKSNDTINLVFDKVITDPNAPTTANEPNGPFKAPGTAGATGTIKVTNSKTKRVLGGVNIEIQSTTDAKRIATTVTQDPPKPEGAAVEKFSEGSYTLIAKRYGYEIYQATVNVGAKDKYFKVDIAMVPLKGLPDPDLQYQSSLSSGLGNTNLSNLGGSVIPLISQLLQYTNQNGNNSAYNNYPYYGQTGNSSIFNGSLNQNSGTSTYGNYPYQTGYSNNTSQTAVVPIMLSIQPQYPLNTTSQNVRFEIYDASTGSSVINTTFDMAQLATQISSATGSITRYGCLNPNYSQYALKVTNLSNSALSVGPYQFTSGSSGQAVVISIPVQSGSALLNNIGYRVVDKSAITLENFTCPSNSLTSLINGQNAWTGTTITDSQIRSYNVFRYTDGKYYMVNTTLGSTDIRPVVFVMSQGAAGGLAFVSAASGLNITSSSQSGWYVTTFTLDDGIPTMDRSKLSKVDMNPADYATALGAQHTIVY